MKFSEYQKLSRKTALYDEFYSITYPALGLAGETGEVIDMIKKYIRHDYDILDEGPLQAIEKELGDVLWYIANLATDLGLDLDIVAEKNIQKLKDRWERKVIKGNGDER